MHSAQRSPEKFSWTKTVRTPPDSLPKNPSPFSLVTTGTCQWMMIGVIEGIDFCHLEAPANIEKDSILGKGVAEHAELQRQLVRDPTHLIHPGFALPFLKHQEIEVDNVSSQNLCQLGGTRRPQWK